MTPNDGKMLYSCTRRCAVLNAVVVPTWMHRLMQAYPELCECWETRLPVISQPNRGMALRGWQVSFALLGELTPMYN